MSKTAQEIAKLLDILPEQDQNLAFEIVKKMVLAWDPDFTKLTKDEISILKAADSQIDHGEIVSSDDINWDE